MEREELDLSLFVFVNEGGKLAYFRFLGPRPWTLSSNNMRNAGSRMFDRKQRQQSAANKQTSFSSFFFVPAVWIGAAFYATCLQPF